MRSPSFLLFCVGLIFGACLAACAAPAIPENSEVALAAPTITLTPTASATCSPTPLPSPTATATPSATPSQTPTPTATRCAETLGVTSSLTITSPTLHYPINARIYLPPCYAVPGRQFPVLYLIHGLNFTESQWEDVGVVTTTNKLIATGEIAPLIIVMPRDRLDPRFDPAFVKDLIPYIDANYHTVPERDRRAIGGMSRGAGWAVRLGLHYPDLFVRVGAHSLAVFRGEEQKIINWAWKPSAPLPKFYIDIGQDDSLLYSASWLNDIFNWYKVPHTYKVQPGAHSAKYWSAHVAEYLRFYAADWRKPDKP